MQRGVPRLIIHTRGEGGHGSCRASPHQTPTDLQSPKSPTSAAASHASRGRPGACASRRIGTVSLGPIDVENSPDQRDSAPAGTMRSVACHPSAACRCKSNSSRWASLAVSWLSPPSLTHQLASGGTLPARPSAPLFTLTLRLASQRRDGTLTRGTWASSRS